jgi:hypothetical protein
MKRWAAGAAAVAAGFVVTAAASIATDMLMHATGLFSSSPRDMSTMMFASAAGYRAVFTAAAGYITARLAPSRPMRHVWALAAIGLAARLGSLAAYYQTAEGNLGPAWYAFSIVAEAIPCVRFGGWLAASRQTEQALVRRPALSEDEDEVFGHN